MFKNEYIKFDEKINLCVYLWEPTCDKKNIKGCIQLAHGMAEHLARYDKFATKLNEEGYFVIGADHIAHGKSCEKVEDLGVIKDYDFIDGIIKSIKLVRSHYDEYFQKPNILFAHSMGSMTAQRYIELYPDDFTHVVLCGSDYPGFLYALAKVITLKRGKQGMIVYNDFVEGLGVGKFNNKFKQENDPYAWLSVNKENRQLYAEDELCGAHFPVNYYHSLAVSLRTSKQKKNLMNINKDLKMFIICGENDPVGNFSKGPIKLYKQYHKLGLDTSISIYENGRHEILNEPDLFPLIIQDLLDFMSK